MTNQTYGGVFHVNRWISLTGTYQESALFTDNLGVDLTGKPRKPTSGEGYDFGVRLSLLDDVLNTSVVYYDNTSENIRNAIDGAVRTELNALLGTNDPLVGNGDSVDRATKGWEFEVVANLRKNWTMRAGMATSRLQDTNFNPQTRAALARAREAATARGLEPDAVTVITRDFLASEDATPAGMRRLTYSFTTRYSLVEGRWRGLALGGSVRFAEGKPQPNVVVTGQEVVAARITDDQLTVSPFASYRRKFGRISWTGQINVNNVFDEVTDQGTVYRYPRYTDPRQVVFTSTFTF